MNANSKIVVFDLGGVLVRIHRSAQQALQSIGYPEAETVRLADSGAFQTLNAEYQSGRIPLDSFIQETAKLLDPVVPYTSLLEAHDAILISEYPGALDVVNDLQRRGVETCILSNTCARHWSVLKEFPAVKAALRDGCFLSFELGMVKPAASIYRTVQEKLGRSAADICFVDDSPQNIQAASEEGWQAKLVPYEREQSDALRDAVRGFGFEF